MSRPSSTVCSAPPGPELSVSGILEENARRRAAIGSPFDPLSGRGAPGPRCRLSVRGLSEAPLFIPEEMEAEEMVAALRRYGDVDSYIRETMRRNPDDNLRNLVADLFDRLRCRHDFPYWAARYATIKRKGGGADILFSLNRPQRRLVERLDAMRRAGRPIRLVLLKARQWGGSTCLQLYMAWLQLTRAVGLNSLIIAHQAAATDEIRDMFDRMIAAYPERLLHEPGDDIPSSPSRRLSPVGRSRAAVRLDCRNCKIKVGTAERPDSCRGGDYNLVHLSEVGIWKKTLGKSPEDIVRSACSGVLYDPLTMIVYESTANGTGNFFHREYEAAARGESQFESLFISWFEIDAYSRPLADAEAFAARLLEMRLQESAASEREQPGRYLWWLWEKGATLEAINWYVTERAKYNDHAQMASEYPSDDVEAFVHSGARVFDRYKVEALRAGCRPPVAVGEVCADGEWGRQAMQRIRFVPDAAGALRIWAMPDASVRLRNRYVAVVDIGGRSAKADWSVVAVFDRLPMASGLGPEVVAQWRGHCDIDLLAWKAAQIARWYADALLVVESNTLETRDAGRCLEGDQSGFILSQIREVYCNLYARRGSPDEIRAGHPVRYGFHTNVNTKPMIISGLVRVIREALYTERCEDCLDEYITYERRPNGSYGAIAGRHDDLLMTRAIGLHICQHELPPLRLPQPATPRRLSPPSSANESCLL